MKVRRGGGKPLQSAQADNASDGLNDEASFPEYSGINIRDQCPKYASIVDGKLGKQVTLEDIDPLQLELETLLVAVVQRKQQLRAQLEALDHDDSLAISSKPSARPDKHKAPLSPLGGPSSKKFRASIADQKTAKKPSKDKSKKTDQSAVGGSISDDSQPDAPNGQKSNRVPIPVAPFLAKDSPHRFWAYLEDFCRPVGEEQITILEDMLEAQEAIKSSDYVKVPPLGTHYTVKWAQEDLLEEQRESTPEANSAKLREDMEKVLRKTAKESLSDERYGTLTQRLMSCLIEENIFVKAEDMPVVSKGRSSASNIASIEQRIRKELEDLGVMQALAEKVAEQDDEVFLELRKCQSQLLSISSQNVRLLKKLLSGARQRMNETSLEGQLRSVDNEILEHFRKRKGTTRTKNSPAVLAPPTKRDKEQLQSLLDRRKAILAELDEAETKRASP